jgi:hypothetical protein
VLAGDFAVADGEVGVDIDRLAVLAALEDARSAVVVAEDRLLPLVGKAGDAVLLVPEDLPGLAGLVVDAQGQVAALVVAVSVPPTLVTAWGCGPWYW